MPTSQVSDTPAPSNPQCQTHESNVGIIFTDINANSDFRTSRTGTDKSVHHALAQVTRHVARGLYKVVSLDASEHSCVVVSSTEKSDEEMSWKNGFPWDRDDDSQPETAGQ